MPEKVRAATELYREEMDPLAGFSEVCTFDPAAWSATARIRAALEIWAKEEGVKTLPEGSELTRWLEEHDCVADRRHQGRGWRGIRCEGGDSEQSFDPEAGF